MASGKTQAVFFDLDGTLVDTAPDMVGALLRVCDEEQQPYPDRQKARDIVSNGSLALINLAFGSGKEQSDGARHRRIDRFLILYEKHICEGSRLFSGIDGLLKQIEAAEIPWGIVTNKPDWLTRPLLRELKLNDRIICRISGDTLEQRKPHPAPLLAAAEAADANPEQCIYLGDAQRDIEAGNAAGMVTLAALWGYIDQRESVKKWSANGQIKRPQEATKWIDFLG